MAATIETHQRKTIRLVVPPHYHSLGYQDYVAELNLSDTPLTLKSAGSRNGDVEGMTLLFRGRRITPDEENLSFEQLMEKCNVSPNEEVLVFHCTIHPDVVSNQQKRNQIIEPTIPASSTSSETAVSHDPSVPTLSQGSNDPVEGSSPQPEITLSSHSPPQPIAIPISPPNSTTTSQTSEQPPPQQTIQQALHRPNIQLLPVQYQAVLINGIPFLVQQPNSPTLRLPSDTATLVRTHLGQYAYIVNPTGVAALSRQGCRIQSYQLSLTPLAPAAQGPGDQQNVGQPQIPPPERRFFGLGDLIGLFRRRGIMQHVWLVCKLAFMVGVFSSNNASWRRIIGLCTAAVGIYLWQTGELERWVGRFRIPVRPPPVPPIPGPAEQGGETQERPVDQERQQDGPMAFLWTFFRLAEQVLFVFVASLWPNAVAVDGIPPPPDVVPPPVPPVENVPEGDRPDQGDRGRALFQDNNARDDVAVE